MTKEIFDSQEFLANTSKKPGVYQMYDMKGEILYVGKAKNLKNRLSSYFRNTGLSIKTVALVNKIHSIEVTPTENESAALILEQNLIKSLKPPYNISFRDDKSYPYIFISDDEFPRISFHRGLKKKKGQYFGPYPNAQAVYQTLNFLQKTFKIRQCENSMFNNRSRPCLQYQINRCTGPCVDLVTKEQYLQDIDHTRLFLQGNSKELMEKLAKNMDVFSNNLAFEKAAEIRDQISMLRTIQSDPGREIGTGKIHVFAYYQHNNKICIHVLFILDGRVTGSKNYYPNNQLDVNEVDFFLGFIEQFYLSNSQREIPHEIIVNKGLADDDKQILADVLSDKEGRKISISNSVRDRRKKWLQLAVNAAEHNLQQQLSSQASQRERYIDLQQRLNLDEPICRMECFDISHSSGELTVASCVVFNEEGPVKSDYRRFNIENITPGDDYAAMEQALSRRYTRIQKEEGVLPDLLLIDGGKGQLNIAKTVLAELGVQQVILLGIAKGTTRKPGFETLVTEEGVEIVLDSNTPALHLLQAIRDEAHRFAITGHKQKRDKKRRTSTLEGIPGVGAKRRRELLRHFGGLHTLKQASIADITKVAGISKKIAEDIYNHLHDQ